MKIYNEVEMANTICITKWSCPLNFTKGDYSDTWSLKEKAIETESQQTDTQ